MQCFEGDQGLGSSISRQAWVGAVWEFEMISFS